MIIAEESKSRFEDDKEVLSSEEEQERIEEEKEKFTASVTIEGVGAVKNMLVCAAGNAQALTKILFDGKLKETGKAEVSQSEKNKDVLKIFYVAEHELLILHPEGLKSSYATQIIPQLFTKLTNAPHRIVFLDSVYKTNYSTTDTGSFSSIDG